MYNKKIISVVKKVLLLLNTIQLKHFKPTGLQPSVQTFSTKKGNESVN